MTTRRETRRGVKYSYGGISSMCEGGTGAREGSGNKDGDDDEHKLNGDEVDGYVFQWRVTMWNGAGLTLAGHNWEVVRGVI